MAMEIVSILTTPITDAAKWFLGGLKRQLSFLTKYDENLEKLSRQARALETKRSDIDGMVEDARRSGDEPYNEVADWLKQTDSIQQVVANLYHEAQVNKRCFKGLCPDLCSRLRLSKRAIKTLDEVSRLQGNGNFTKVSRKRPPLGVERVQVDWVEGFPSREMIMEKVMEALRDECIRSIGVYGMGGSGKTTLMKTLNNKLAEEKLFDIVIMVTVSKEPNLKEIQVNIGSRLGLKFETEDSLVTRANKLLNRLKMEEKVLFILDDVWEQLDITKVGLPCESEHKGCKFIITTRNVEVCRRMKIKTQMEMELLSETESWNLFEEKVGNVITLPSLKPIAEEIVTRCKGSPLAISVLGSSLWEVEIIAQWRHALNVLQNPHPGGVQGIMQEIATPLRYSYDNLHGSEIKLCFLFCCLFPEDYNIELSDLRNYGIAEGFLNANGGSLERASDELVDYIEKLKNRCLLLDGDVEGYVKVHDVVRDVAIWIASEDDNGFRVNIGPTLGNWSQIEKLNSYKRISFMNFDNGLNLSVPSECEQLQLRSLLIIDLMSHVDDDTVLHENCFNKMKALIVFDMRGGTLFDRVPVPESVSHFTNLKTLVLVKCDISTRVDMLGGMINLEILCLRESMIRSLPKEIGNLTKLKCLDLTDAVISAVAPNVISRLSNLEELLALNSLKLMVGMLARQSSYEDWDEELASLVRLSRLEVQLRSERFNPDSLPWRSLKQFCVGIDSYTNSYGSGSLYLGETNPMTHWITPLSMMTQRLFLEKCNGFTNILDVCENGGFKRLEKLDLEELPELKSICEGTSSNGCLEKLRCLHVIECHNLEYLVSARAAKELPNLKELSVCYNDGMKNFVMCTKEEPSTTCFQNLQKLKIQYCPRLKKIFSFTVALGLRKLTSVEITNCDGLECMIGMEEEEAAVMDRNQGDLLPQLGFLVLRDLHRLTSIYQGNLPLHSPNLKMIDVHRCPNLGTIPLSSECTNVYTPKVETLPPFPYFIPRVFKSRVD